MGKLPLGIELHFRVSGLHGYDSAGGKLSNSIDTDTVSPHESKLAHTTRVAQML